MLGSLMFFCQTIMNMKVLNNVKDNDNIFFNSNSELKAKQMLKFQIHQCMMKYGSLSMIEVCLTVNYTV